MGYNAAETRGNTGQSIQRSHGHLPGHQRKLKAECGPFGVENKALDVILLQFPILIRSLADTSCFSTMKHRAHMDGDEMIAGFFPLYTLGIDCSNSDNTDNNFYCRFIFKRYQFVLALMFAIEEINKNPDILHNLTLGFDIYNLRFGAWTAFKNPFLSLFGKYNTPNYTCMRDRKSIAVLTGPSGITSAQIGALLGLYIFPQLTFGPFDQVLSDHIKFPALYQMAPKDTSMATAMVSLLLYFSWNWVGLLTLEDENGLWILLALKEQMAKNRVCIGFEIPFPKYALSDLLNAMRLYNQINKSSANVLIIYGDNEALVHLLMSMEQYFIKGKVCIVNSQWDFSMTRRYFMLGLFHIPLIFSHHHPEVSGFTDFVKAVNPSKYIEDFFLARLWFLSFNCSDCESDCVTWENCLHEASLDWFPRHIFDMTMSGDSYNIYNAVYAVAQALHEMVIHHTEVQTMGNRKQTVASPAQLHPYLKNTQFQNPAGDPVILDEKRKLEAEYDIVNIWNFPEGLQLEVKVGMFSPYALHGHQLSFSEDMVEWSIATTELPHSVCSESCGPGFRKSPQEGKAACCFDCTPCPEDEMANGTDMEQCVKCPHHQYANTQRNQCLLRATSFLAYGEPLGMALACMALGLTTLTAVVLGVFVKHQNNPIVKANNQALSYILLLSLIFCFLCSFLFIGRPNTVACILQQTTFGVAFTVAVSAVLAKTLTVLLAFKVTSPGRRMRWMLVSRAPNFIIPICTLIQVTLCGIWLGTSPPFIETDTHSEHGHLILLCNKGSLTAFYCVLGYLGSLALASFTVAFLARNLPDTFNEAKFLTFSMLVFCSVWLTFLPVYHSAKGKVMVAVEVFSILASSAGLLGCIFAPKCYIILIRPDRSVLHGFQAESPIGIGETMQSLTPSKVHNLEEITGENGLPSRTIAIAFKNPFICFFGNYTVPNFSCKSGSKSIGALTGPSEVISTQIGTLLCLYRFPRLTIGPFDEALNDHRKFPALYQMAAKDTSIATAMVSLLLYFRWNWVGLLTFQDGNGLWILHLLKKK
ncbi:vomeronasal type-2 receptor 116-like [Perognathus longimembris pacificus]|uniref:vomeronasal type-2 receptor 116-like n=1 Tax=Perognathus longimembris pacificus TaxID=214514 RepID=UPI0020187EC4|nr:vomeronasal type-2 receptor 116-like [Perognathus longimembris pacificus]